jgi:hypothetical protein
MLREEHGLKVLMTGILLCEDLEMKNTMEILRVINKGQHMNTLEKYHI